MHGCMDAWMSMQAWRNAYWIFIQKLSYLCYTWRLSMYECMYVCMWMEDNIRILVCTMSRMPLCLYIKITYPDVESYYFLSQAIHYHHYQGGQPRYLVPIRTLFPLKVSLYVAAFVSQKVGVPDHDESCCRHAMHESWAKCTEIITINS
jgi:hypothetical protein